MAAFHYKVATASGEVLEGDMDAASQDLVIKSLQAQGYVPIRIDPAPPRTAPTSTTRSLFRRRRVTRDDVAVFTLELTTLLQSGLALDRALAILLDLTESPPAQEMISAIGERVRDGESLSASLAAQGDTFPHFYVSMVRAGESAGALEPALERLDESMRRAAELRETIQSALIYPILLIMVAAASLTVILGFVVPRFSQLFEDAGQALPWSTQVVVALGAFIQHYWWALALGFTALWLFVRRQARDPVTRARWDSRVLSVPLLGDLIAKLETARFTRLLSTLLSNGLPLPDAMRIAIETIGNRAIVQGMERVADAVRRGEGLARPLRDAKIFPVLAGELLWVGEESGELEDMLGKLAEIYDREVRTTTARILSFVEPALILGLGLVIAAIIMSILVALLGVNELNL